MGDNIDISKLHENIGSYIKTVMRDKEITQQNLAGNLLAGQPTVAQYLSGKTPIPIENLFKICCYLGISMDKVTGLDNIFNSSENISLSNVCESLSNLNDMVPLEFSKIEIDGKSYNCIYSKHKNVNDTVHKLAEIIDCCDGDKDVFNTWKKSFIKKNKNRLKEYGFNTKEEIEKKYLKRWILLTFKQTETYRRIDDYTNSKSTSYNDLVKSCKMHYSSFSKKEVGIIYDAINNDIKEYLKDSAEYISLDIFKKIHEENQRFNTENSFTNSNQDETT